MKRRGIFVVVDGLDGVGKGEAERAIIAYEQKFDRAVLDTVAFSRANSKGLPELKDFWDPPRVHYNTLSTAEPTYCGIGHNIRNEIIFDNGRNYSSKVMIDAYSMDRLIQMKRVVIPALENGLNVIQARCMAATLTYQMVAAAHEGMDFEEVKEYILSRDGNKLQLENAPDLLIIPIIESASELEKRLKERAINGKEDRAIFENVAFQSELNPFFKSEWLRKIFEAAGTKVVYLDASISEQSTRQQAVNIYKSFLEERNIRFKERRQKP